MGVALNACHRLSPRDAPLQSSEEKGETSGLCPSQTAAFGKGTVEVGASGYTGSTPAACGSHGAVLPSPESGEQVQN